MPPVRVPTGCDLAGVVRSSARVTGRCFGSTTGRRRPVGVGARFRSSRYVARPRHEGRTGCPPILGRLTGCVQRASILDFSGLPEADATQEIVLPMSGVAYLLSVNEAGVDLLTVQRRIDAFDSGHAVTQPRRGGR